MILHRYLIASTVVVACALTWTSTGCRQKQPPHGYDRRRQSDARGQLRGNRPPRRRWSRFAWASSSSSGFVSQDDRASSRFQVSNEVTSQLIPPADGNSIYRGTITVTSSSTYSLRRSADDSNDKKNQDQSPKDNGSSLLDESDADSGFHSMDDQLVSAAPDGDKSAPDSIESVQRRTAKDVRTYKLAYEHNRWVLKTELDPETEKSIAKAFERALRLQP